MNVEPITLEPDDGQPIKLLEFRRSDASDDPLDYPSWVIPREDHLRIIWQANRGGTPDESRPGMLITEASEPDWKLCLRLWTRFENPSPLETGLIIGHLRDRGVGTDQVLLAMDQFLDLPRSEEWLDCYARFPDLPETIQTAVHEGAIDPRHIRFVDRMPESFGETFLKQLGEKAVALSVQETRKLMESLRRLEESEVDELTTLLKELPAREEEASPRERGNILLDRAGKMAYPRTTQRQQEFDETLEELDPSGQIHVQPPTNFEGDYLDFRIRCHRDNSLEELAEELKQCQPLLDYV